MDPDPPSRVQLTTRTLLSGFQIATDYGKDAALTSLLNTMDIYMLLLANPDGYAYTHDNVG